MCIYNIINVAILLVLLIVFVVVISDNIINIIVCIRSNIIRHISRINYSISNITVEYGLCSEGPLQTNGLQKLRPLERNGSTMPTDPQHLLSVTRGSCYPCPSAHHAWGNKGSLLPEGVLGVQVCEIRQRNSSQATICDLT